jgi:DNA modification methylase
MIFCDPPYRKEDLPLYKDLAELATRVLKPGGSIVAYIGGSHIFEIGDFMKESGLTYWWIICVKHNGGWSKMWKQKTWVHWKPLLWFVKGDKPEFTAGDIHDLIESTPPDKADHDWAQSPTEAEYMISHLTVENQIVLDPFLGRGTTAIASLKLNRKFIGIEVNEDTFNIAKHNISESLSPTKKQK